MATGEDVSISQGRYYHDKKAFIHTQIRLLEAPVQLPSDWRATSRRLLKEAALILFQMALFPQPYPNVIHASTKKSSRLTFNNQSVRQLLEQLEANQYELRKKARQGGIIIRTKPVQEQRLHFALNAAKAQKYADLRSRIVTLQKKYQSLKDRHDHYKALQLEVRRLQTGEIQQNILSPDSQVVQELQKMKALLPQLLSVLQSRRHILAAKRKHQAVASGQDADATKRQRQQPSNPLDAAMECL
ncbi:hypothetical protein B0O80DRAFT_500107 [Mortierella sp. GBAus27b]|nr:hypothetical protein B0O80DRAFT_500107 [Mortierella sp. GBAus27b]